MNNQILDNLFRLPAKGTDPVTKGTFVIEWAYMVILDEEDDCSTTYRRARGKIKIDGNNNPLFQLAKEAPLRLQGLIAHVDFGVEKAFIKIESINNYHIIEDGIVNEIELDPVTFCILDNLEYLENIQEYKWNNLL